jgi:hypothetical protein
MLLLTVSLCTSFSCAVRKTGNDLDGTCDGANPPPQCAQTCDPTPGAVNTCDAGFHCNADGTCEQSCVPGSATCAAGLVCSTDGRCIPAPCRGLQCQQVTCPSGGTTSISGIVLAPNGTLPLSNATVYVPNAAVAPITEGAGCQRCDDVLSGEPLVTVTTDAQGKFTLPNMPVGADIPVVIQIGKWRRQIVIPAVSACVDMPLTATETRLPRNKVEGDIPKFAISTGGADAIECLLRKIGVDDAEFTPSTGTGRINLFAGAGGSNKFDAANGAGTFGPSSTTLWDSVDDLKKYDVTVLSCEGGYNEGEKPVSARAAMKAYADLGGRVLASHWHHYWLKEGPPEWASAVTVNPLIDLANVTGDIDVSTPRGLLMSQWLVNVGASTMPGKIDLVDAQHTIVATAPDVQQWITVPVNANNTPSVQYMSFTTPREAPEADRCGRMVVSDIHVSTGDDSGPALAFPAQSCITDKNVLTPQEKVLAYMIFDISSCIAPGIE